MKDEVKNLKEKWFPVFLSVRIIILKVCRQSKAMCMLFGILARKERCTASTCWVCFSQTRFSMLAICRMESSIDFCNENRQ